MRIVWMVRAPWYSQGQSAVTGPQTPGVPCGPMPWPAISCELLRLELTFLSVPWYPVLAAKGEEQVGSPQQA